MPPTDDGTGGIGTSATKEPLTLGELIKTYSMKNPLYDIYLMKNPLHNISSAEKSAT